MSVESPGPADQRPRISESTVLIPQSTVYLAATDTRYHHIAVGPVSALVVFVVSQKSCDLGVEITDGLLLV